MDFVLLLATALGLWLGRGLNYIADKVPVRLHALWLAEAQAFISGATDIAGSSSTNTSDTTHRWQHRNWGHFIHYLPTIIQLRALAATMSMARLGRYVAVEVLTALLTLALIYRYGWYLECLLWVGFVYTGLVLAVIDFETRLLPDSLTLPLLWAGLLINTLGLGTISVQEAVMGAAPTGVHRSNNWMTRHSSWFTACLAD